MDGRVGGWIYRCSEGWTHGLIHLRGHYIHSRKVLPPFLIPSSAAGSVDGTLLTSTLTLNKTLKAKYHPCTQRDDGSCAW